MFVAPAYLSTVLPLKCGFGLGGGRVGDAAALPAMLPDAAPLADEAPCAEEVRLHIEPIIAVQVLGRVDTMQG
jgi:hypothetical protein